MLLVGIGYIFIPILSLSYVYCIINLTLNLVFGGQLCNSNYSILSSFTNYYV